MALHNQLRAVAEQYGVHALHDSDGLRRSLEAQPDAGQVPSAQRDLLVETVRWGGLPRLTDAVNQGMDPDSAIATTGEAIARDRGSADVDGTRWALASLAFAAGHLPESDVLRWSVPGASYDDAVYGAAPLGPDSGQEPGQAYPGQPTFEYLPPGYQPPDEGRGERSKSPLIIAIVAAVVLLLAAGGLVWWLASDDGYDEAAYCDAYQQARQQLESFDLSAIDGDEFAQVEQQVERMRELAPPELEDEWETIDDALGELESILEDAGLSPGDLEGLTQGQLPEGFDPSQLEELSQRLNDFLVRQAELADASEAVRTDAETRCN